MWKALPIAILLSLLVGCGPTATPTALPTVAPTATPLSPAATSAAPTAVPTAIPIETVVPPTATLAPTRPPTCSGPRPPAEASLGDTWLRPTDGMIMVYVPGGTFRMGGDKDDSRVHPDELPQHTVTVDGFWIDQTEVTNAQFTGYLNANGNTREGGGIAIKFGAGYVRIAEDDGTYSVREAGASHPVVMVTWYGAKSYCEWVGGRLPTEAEWEYAARGPENRLYPWGNDPPNCDRANFGDCGRNTSPVGIRPAGASWCGALDMVGNVWEWVVDWFHDYPATEQFNPIGPTSGDFPIMRGGGWHSPWWDIRPTFRQHGTAASSWNG